MATTGGERFKMIAIGELVNIDDSSRRRSAGGSASANKALSRRSKSALVLGGGGLTGAVYEIGALRALDLLSVNHSATTFDVIVGTSAGAFVSALLANGVTPEQMMSVICPSGRDDVAPLFPDVGLPQLLRPSLIELALRGLTMPLRAISLVREIGPRIREISLLDVAIGLGGSLPAGLYSGAGIASYLRDVLTTAGRSDDFRKVGPELYIAATDLDSCERVSFGAAGWDDIPISRSVQASAALPMVYKPVMIRGREFVDGGLVSTTNLDIAVDAGAKLIVVINPLVPYHNNFTRVKRSLRGTRPLRISDMGLPHVGFQAFKMMAHQRLHAQKRVWEERYPGVDIVLVEPAADDELMFRTAIMDYSKRIEIANHGFRSVTHKLANDYEDLREIVGRHGITISAERMRQAIAEAEQNSTTANRA